MLSPSDGSFEMADEDRRIVAAIQGNLRYETSQYTKTNNPLGSRQSFAAFQHTFSKPAPWLPLATQQAYFGYAAPVADQQTIDPTLISRQGPGASSSQHPGITAQEPRAAVSQDMERRPFHDTNMDDVRDQEVMELGEADGSREGEQNGSQVEPC